MKTLLVIALLVSTSSFAAEEIVKAPNIAFGRYLIPVTELCINGDSIQALNPVYTRECSGDSDCIPETVNLSRKLVYSAETCTSSNGDSADCPRSDLVMETFRIPTQYTLEVYQYSASGDYASQTPSELRVFNVPACK